MSKSTVVRRPSSAFRHLWPVAMLWLLPLGWLWWRLVDHLRIEWSLNPQYSYGWAVPLLCVYLIWQRGQRTEDGHRKTEDGRRRTAGWRLASAICLPVLVFLAVLYAPARLVEVANPDWRLVSWALAIIVVGITLLLLRQLTNERGQGSDRSVTAFRFPAFRFSDFVFPLCFFFIAVPWPTVIEAPLVQGLTRANAAVTVELMNALGVPALQHGNVIEVATGVVGIDEACSGIRSFQAALMIALFLGDLYWLTLARRSTLVMGGFALSFLFNVGRTSLLVWVAANKGVAAIASWHDPAGIAILVGCFCGLWLLGVWLKRGTGRKLKAESGKRESGKQTREGGGTADNRTTDQSVLAVNGLPSDVRPQSSGGPVVNSLPSALRPLSSAISISLCAWLIAVEVGVEWWYRSHESRLARATEWNVAWPTNNPTFKELPFAEKTRQILRYDDGRNAAWQSEGVVWQVVFLRWGPGRTAPMLARNHTPEVCLPATGRRVTAAPDLMWFEAQGLRLPFRSYVVTDARTRLHVFYCLWSDVADTQGFETAALNYGNRLGPVLQGLRNSGQRSIEIIVAGVRDDAGAAALVRKELPGLIAVRVATGDQR